MANTVKSWSSIWHKMGCPSIWPDGYEAKGLTKELAAMPEEARWRFFIILLEHTARRVDLWRRGVGGQPTKGWPRKKC